MSPSAPREPAPTSGTPETDRGSGGVLWRALRFPFTLGRRLRGVERRVDRLEGGLVRLERGLAAAAERTEVALTDLRSRLDRFGDELAGLHDQLVLRHASAEQRLDLIESAVRTVQGELEQLRDTRAVAMEQRLDRTEAGLARVRDEVLPAAVDRSDVLVDRLAEQLEELASLVERILRAEPLPAPLPATVEHRLAVGLDAVTSRVLTAFRGDETEIRHRLDRYLPPLRAAAPVLDLGCGRGELLLLLREAGVSARGVDGDPALVEAARRRGLEVTNGDVLETLRGLPDRSHGAVAAIHLLEHLPPATLLATLHEVLRVLRPGGLLVVESPNPHTLRVGASLYWRDPTHHHPLLPETLDLYLKAAGFTVESTELLHPFPAEQRLAGEHEQPAHGEPAVTALAAEVLRLERRLDDLLNGPRDFAILARRPEGGA